MAEHNTLTDPELHEPKGISAASDGQYYRSNGAGSGVWTDFPAVPDAQSFTPVLSAASTIAQEPSTTDSPIQVSFGAAQNGLADPVMVDSLGTVTFNETGLYTVTLRLSVGRLTGAGTAKVLARGLFNDVQIGTISHTFIDSVDIEFPVFLTQDFLITAAGATLKWELARDSDGNNSGGLLPFSPTTLPWGDSPSAQVNVFRIGIE